MHDVVITGMGAVSPLGATVDEFERNLFQGRHGIVPLPEERKEGLTVQVYAPVAGFEPESHFSALELRRQDPYTTFGLAAVREAVSQAGMLGEVDPFRLGVYLTSGLGCASTVVGEYDTLQ